MLQSFIQSFLSYFGLRVVRYPSQQMEDLNKILSFFDISLIIDVGANIGQFTTYVRNCGFSKKIISFEPLEREFQLLQKKHSTDKYWGALNMAVGDFDGEAYINRAENSFSSSILEVKQDFTNNDFKSVGIKPLDKQFINVIKLDTFFKDNQIDSRENIFLKIDVQGFEKKVIDGGSKSLQFIKAIQLEMSIEKVYEGGISFEEMLSLLSSYGFKLIYIIPGFCNPKTGQMIEFDGIFLNSNLTKL